MKNLLVFILCLPLFAGAASAGVIYSFSGTSNLPIPFPGPFTFTLTSSSFITSDSTFIAPGPTLTCNECNSIQILPSHPGTATDSLQIEYDFPDGDALEFYFPPAASDAAGDYTTIFSLPNPGTLTATGTPEPTPAASLIVGLGALLVYARRNVTVR